MNTKRHLIFFKIIFLNCFFSSFAQIILTQNVGDALINPYVGSCSQPEHWARAFTLSEFGISTADVFQINSGNVGVRNSVGQDNATIQFNIYSIDSGFPDTFSESNLIGSSQIEFFPFVSTLDPQIVTINFNTPVIVPADVERILVEVKKTDGTGFGVMNILLAGTAQGGDPAWYKGCLGYTTYTSTDIAPLPRPNAHLYITANGLIINNTITYNFRCLGDDTEFHLNYDNEIEAILWDFGDGTTSTLENPTHFYGASGLYDVSTTVYALGSSVPEVINKQIEIFAIPTINPISDVYACEDALGTGYSSSFDTSNIQDEILNGQNNMIVKYFNGNGALLPSPLPSTLSNSIPDNETITVRVSNQNAAECFLESTFNLVVNPVPSANYINDLIACDENNDGFAPFDLSNVPNAITSGQSGLTVELQDSNDAIISAADYGNFVNLTPNQDYIKAVVINPSTSCLSDIVFNLIVNDTPIANTLPIMLGCDDNNDGISEYFDTTNLESRVLDGQTGMTASYFDQNGNQLPSPLPNPYTNLNPFNESIIVRVTNTTSTCYAETALQLQTVTQPNITQPNNLYACDLGNGYAEFNTSQIEQQLIGNQTGLIIYYYDADNNQLPSPLPMLFQNTEPFSQTIFIRVEDASNPICNSETSFEIIVNNLPEITLEDEYFICNLQPSITLTVNSVYNTYNWLFEDQTLISDTYNAAVVNEGNYVLSVTQIENGITCENSFFFTLIRSVLPEIQHVNYGQLGDNFIEIIALGDGNFEYSIDGFYYQESNYFPNVQGGVYTVFVRDKEGCGEDSEEVTIVDYPKFFTPNNDGYNDFWQIKGIHKFPNANILIFDRFGKLLAQLSSNDLGWNGLFNEQKMMSNDYWFRANLGNGINFSGHFSLKR